MKREMTPEERDEWIAAKIYAALVGFTIFVATVSVVVYKVIEEVLCNR